MSKKRRLLLFWGLFGAATVVLCAGGVLLLLEVEEGSGEGLGLGVQSLTVLKKRAGEGLIAGLIETRSSFISTGGVINVRFSSTPPENRFPGAGTG